MYDFVSLCQTICLSAFSSPFVLLNIFFFFTQSIFVRWQPSSTTAVTSGYRLHYKQKGQKTSESVTLDKRQLTYSLTGKLKLLLLFSKEVPLIPRDCKI